jgi:hypothetical protein
LSSDGPLDSRSRRAFALVILAQAAHSVEEYVYRLFDVFAPARFVSGLFNSDHALGFALANALLVGFGVWCYLARVRPARPGAHGYAWFWAGLEAVNGTSHVFFSMLRGGYFPGVGTAPLLLAAAGYLGTSLTSGSRTESRRTLDG